MPEPVYATLKVPLDKISNLQIGIYQRAKFPKTTPLAM